MTDTIHSVAAIASVSLLSGGAWLALGAGWSLIVLGSLLLAGVVYARTRSPDARQPD